MRKVTMSPVTLAGIVLAATLTLANCSGGSTSDNGAAVNDDNAAEETEMEADDSASEGDSGDVQPDSQGLSDDDIVSAIEPDGFECTEKDRLLEGREQWIQCKGDDYIYITATRYTTSEELENQLKRSKSVGCKEEIVEVMRFAVSDPWLLVPGGEGDQDIAAFKQVTDTLGLELVEDPC